MNDTKLISDLEEATRIAKEGRNAPLLGGEIGLSWTVLATLSLMAHGATLSGWTPLSPQAVGLIWLTYGIVGTVLSVILARRLDKSASATESLINRAAQTTWVSSGLMIFAAVMSIIVAVNVNGYSYQLFNVIPALAFSLATISYAVLSRLTDQGYLKFAAIASGSAAVITLMMVNEPHMYFVAGILLIISGVIPSFIEIRKAQSV